MSSTQIIKYYLNNIWKLSDEDRENIYLVLKKMNEYYYFFIENKTEENIFYLNNKKLLRPRHFYALGYSKDRDVCILEKDEDESYGGALGGIMIRGVRDANETTYIMIRSLDYFFYTFWLRRYNDGTINIVKKVLDFALFALK